MKEKTNENLISQTTVLSMGFTKSMIDKLIPAPILKQNSRYKSAAPMKLWKEADVLAAMDTDAFREAAAKAAQRKQAAAKAVDTKRKNAEVLADDLIASIHVQRIDMQTLQKLAVAAQQKWYDFNGKDEIVDPSRETVNRWMVNYIRHNLCEYDDSLYMLFRPGSLADKEELYPKVKRETLAKIAQVYPELAEECKTQSNF